MNVLSKPLPRFALCTLVGLVIGIGGSLVTGRWLFSSEAQRQGWVDAMQIFRSIGLLEYMSDEDMPDAVFESLACLWFPLALLASWQLNRWLKRTKSWESKS